MFCQIFNKMFESVVTGDLEQFAASTTYHLPPARLALPLCYYGTHSQAGHTSNPIIGDILWSDGFKRAKHF